MGNRRGVRLSRLSKLKELGFIFALICSMFDTLHWELTLFHIIYICFVIIWSECPCFFATNISNPVDWSESPFPRFYFDVAPWSFLLKSERTESFNLEKRCSSFAFFPAAAAIFPNAIAESPMGPWFRSAMYLPPSPVTMARKGPLWWAKSIDNKFIV